MTARIRIGGSFRTLRDAAAYRAECMDPDGLCTSRDDVVAAVEAWEGEAAKLGESPWRDDDGGGVTGLREATIDLMTERAAARGPISVEASHARPSECLPDVAGAMDVDVAVTMPDGSVLSGEVTMVPMASGQLSVRGAAAYVAYGDCPDTWVSSRLLMDLRGPADDDAETMRRWLDALEAAASTECES